MSDESPYSTLDKTPYVTPDTTTRHTRSETFRLNKNFIGKMKSSGKSINNEIFNEYFGYESPTFVAEDLFKASQTKNNHIVNRATDSLDGLKNSIIKIEIPENQNPDKIIDFLETILKFNNKQ